MGSLLRGQAGRKVIFAFMKRIKTRMDSAVRGVRLRMNAGTSDHL